MDFLDATLLGLVQGMTEFLPVSSSGHLYLVEEFLGLAPSLHLEITLHVATLAAAVLYFRQRIWRLICGVVRMLWSHKKNSEGVLGLQLLLATLVTAVIGLTLEPFFEDFLSVTAVAGTLIFTGMLILFVEKYHAKKVTPLTWKLALLLGLVQGISVIPGISRSGVTIAMLIGCGIKRREAAELSFLLSVPTILGAFLFLLRDAGYQMPTLGAEGILACVVSFGAALLAIHWMIWLVEKRWVWFAPYTILLGGGLLVYLYWT